MKSTPAWNPASLLQSALFEPLSPVLERLASASFPDMHHFNGLLAAYRPAITVKQGHVLSFVPQEPGKMGFESRYEPRCYLNGEVQTRADNWHDLFNALVWLTFPASKAAINSRHFQALQESGSEDGSQRGSVRDMATLLDESGVIVVSSNALLLDMLRAFQWKELFWHERNKVREAMGFYILGHGLYEKSLVPYIGMTGQGLLLQVPEEFFWWTLQARLTYLDEQVAGYVNNPDLCTSTSELSPVPILGIPGWTAANNDATYYDNTAYFRPPRNTPRLL